MLNEPDFRLVFAILRQLPSDKRWTAQERQKWLTALEKAIDLLIEIKEAAEAPHE